jgi:hypothetical protein
MAGRRVGIDFPFEMHCAARPCRSLHLVILFLQCTPTILAFAIVSSRGSLQRLPTIVAHLSKDTAHDGTIDSVPRRGRYTYAAVNGDHNNHGP